MQPDPASVKTLADVLLALGSAADSLFYFRIDWNGGVPSVFNPLGSDFMTFDAEGMIYVGGLTPGEVPCRGILTVDYFRTKTIRYELDFDLDDELYHYVGEKVDVNLLKPLFLIKTHTTCYGTLSRSDGIIISRSVTHFEPETLVPFIRSFHLE